MPKPKYGEVYESTVRGWKGLRVMYLAHIGGSGEWRGLVLSVPVHGQTLYGVGEILPSDTKPAWTQINNWRKVS